MNKATTVPSRQESSDFSLSNEIAGDSFSNRAWQELWWPIIDASCLQDEVSSMPAVYEWRHTVFSFQFSVFSFQFSALMEIVVIKEKRARETREKSLFFGKFHLPDNSLWPTAETPRTQSKRRVMTETVTPLSPLSSQTLSSSLRHLCVLGVSAVGHKLLSTLSRVSSIFACFALSRVFSQLSYSQTDAG
jgi:hypothetical protein